MIRDFFQVLYFSSLGIVLFGLTGNILMFIVYSQQGLRNLSISFYFRSQALVNFVCTLIWIRIFLIFVYSYKIEAQSVFLCKFITYLVYVVPAISNWLSVAVSIDRTAAIVYHQQFPILQKLKLKISVVLFIYGFTLLYYSFLLYDQNLVVAGGGNNNSSNSSNRQFFYCIAAHPLRVIIMDVCYLTMTPFFIMTIATIVMCVFLIRSRRKSMNIVSRFRLLTRQRDIKFGIMSISLNIMFLVLNTPNSFVNLILFYVDEGISYLAIYISFLLLAFFYSNYAFNFYLQLIVNSLVRAQFFKLFVRKKNRIGLYNGR